MTNEDAQRLHQENNYLKARCARLQPEVDDLSRQLYRTTQQFERISLRRTAANPLDGGQ